MLTRRPNGLTTYRVHTPATAHSPAVWECYASDCTEAATGTIETASGATHRACPGHGGGRVTGS